MALILPSKERNAGHGTQHTKKYSSTSQYRNKDLVRNRLKKDNQDFDPQTPFRFIVRKWPTWPDLESLAQKAANINNATNETSNGQLNPVERWFIETQQQSPWNAIAAVNAASDNLYEEFGATPEDVNQDGSTDNKTWYPNI
ncbi:hypothetical protein N431DRAFT_434050 [Stipitochalara longipes BDJ]|nr:hypothetical protein N431DRAFT_434050 [Stipitochalara longipes BDJ]